MGSWRDGKLVVEDVRRPPHAGRCTVYRPDIGGLLPVYVYDDYEGFEVRTFDRLSDEELDRYLDSNVRAVRDVAAAADIEAGFANHVLMGPVILARGLGDLPYAVKVHGSALEYTLKPHYKRFAPYASEGLVPARAVLVGSRHTAESLWAAMPHRGPAGTHLPGPARRRHPHVRAARARRGPGGPGRARAVARTPRSATGSARRRPRRSTRSAILAGTHRPARSSRRCGRGTTRSGWT